MTTLAAPLSMNTKLTVAPKVEKFTPIGTNMTPELLQTLESKVDAIQDALKLAMAQLQFAQSAVHQLQREIQKLKENKDG